MSRQAEEFYNAGDYSQALAVLEQIIDRDTASTKELLLAGECAALIGDTTKAEQIFRKNLKQETNDPEAYYNLGVFYSHCGRAEEAFMMYQKGYELSPSYLYCAEALSRMMRTAGWFKQAEVVARDILKFHPTNVSAYKELASILVASGKADEAVSVFEKGIEVKPDDLFIRSQLLMAMNYSTAYSQSCIYQKSLEWAQAAANNSTELLTVAPQKIVSEGDTAKIRIGYISGDFRRHSVAYFIEPILFNHDRHTFEIFCYSYTTALDHVSDRIQKMTDHWRDMVRMPTDLDCARIIAEDQLDILVDLGGHTFDGVKALVYGPAPIQVTYLGYPNTTGLPNVDYRFTDAFADPEEQDQYYSEKLYHLKSGFLSFAPPEEVPDVVAPPCLNNQYITFGSFNNYAKVTTICIEMWSKILQRVDHSRLIIKSKLFNEQGFKQDVTAAFVANGIDAERLTLTGHIQSLAGHLDAYSQVDIALDTFPYNGTTTTCEALWMGVPVVSRYGDDHRSRVGLSILSQIELPSFAAGNARDYMKQAIKLAGDYQRLASLRSSLRDVLAGSSVCDAVSTTREIEAAYKSWTRP